jgi:hypothetical protein
MRLRSGLCVLALFAAVSICGQAYAQDVCPVTGDAKSVRVQALNILKNREVAPRSDQIDQSATLERAFQPGDDTNRFDDQKGAVFEALVVGVKVGGIETVNCHAKDAGGTIFIHDAAKDVPGFQGGNWSWSGHMDTLVPSKTPTSFFTSVAADQKTLGAISLEMIAPQVRPAGVLLE